MPQPDADTCIVRWDEARKRTHERGFSMPYVGRQTGAEEIGLHLSAILPGERAHPPHAHADEEILFLLEGTAEALIGTRRASSRPTPPCSAHPPSPTASATAARRRCAIWSSAAPDRPQPASTTAATTLPMKAVSGQAMGPLPVRATTRSSDGMT